MSVVSARAIIGDVRLRLLPAALVIVLGCTVLVGWLLDSRTLISLSPNYASMKANTAVAFVLAGMALSLLTLDRARPVARMLAAVVSTIGLATLLEYVLGVSLGIDDLLFADPHVAVGAHPPGRMGANTAFCFTVAGLSLLAIDVSRRGVRPAQIGALTIAVVAFVAVLGYAFEVPSLETGFVSQEIVPMALHTACGFLLLTVAIFMARPGVGMLRLATSRWGGAVALEQWS